MKYIITEEQSESVNQTKFDMGPFGPSIRKIVDMYAAPFIEKYVIVYLKEYDSYMVLMWSNRGAVRSEVEYKIKDFINQFIPVDVTVTILSQD
jgi:hypothetical protein